MWEYDLLVRGSLAKRAGDEAGNCGHTSSVDSTLWPAAVAATSESETFPLAS